MISLVFFIYFLSESHKVCAQIFHTLLLLGKFLSEEVSLNKKLFLRHGYLQNQYANYAHFEVYSFCSEKVNLLEKNNNCLFSFSP